MPGKLSRNEIEQILKFSPLVFKQSVKENLKGLQNLEDLNNDEEIKHNLDQDDSFIQQFEENQQILQEIKTQNPTDSEKQFQILQQQKKQVEQEIINVKEMQDKIKKEQLENYQNRQQTHKNQKQKQLDEQLKLQQEEIKRLENEIIIQDKIKQQQEEIFKQITKNQTIKLEENYSILKHQESQYEENNQDKNQNQNNNKFQQSGVNFDNKNINIQIINNKDNIICKIEDENQFKQQGKIGNEISQNNTQNNNQNYEQFNTGVHENIQKIQNYLLKNKEYYEKCLQEAKIDQLNYIEYFSDFVETVFQRDNFMFLQSDENKLPLFALPEYSKSLKNQ
ncbi:hypothetical protein PPERSA_07877 [Pseudocohnilembus persalinus]|uniref:Uncharacterized protein n=1 Tax=Pseudocohnilembus persalinus TaxID=266149 RepID=A0A0V0QC73_PSEPJ|nr:hypothetical protein PPERSA_07877 [Pseudocohnilembus persalinus]|eukprot:KRW99800.1 hypothetical protein PPERSA_07877 [Pseudocohnilembus persalinus]